MRFRGSFVAILVCFVCLPDALAQPVVSGAVNGASYSTRLAPGAIVSIFGTELASSTTLASDVPLPTELDGTMVIIDGLTAPLYFVSPGQVNAQIPYEASGDEISVVVRTGEGESDPLMVELSTTAPALFSWDSTGRGPGIVLNAGFGRKDDVQPGDVVILYAAGLGQTDPPATTGSGGSFQEPFNRVVDPIEVVVGERVARVLFAGLAPQFPGVYQLNVEIPENLASNRIYLTSGRRPGNFVETQIAEGSNVSSATGRIEVLYPTPTSHPSYSPVPLIVRYAVRAELAPGAGPFFIAAVSDAGYSLTLVDPQAGSWESVNTVLDQATSSGDFTSSGIKAIDFNADGAPFPNNIIPLMRLDPDMVQAAQLLEFPNVPGVAGWALAASKGPLSPGSGFEISQDNTAGPHNVFAGYLELPYLSEDTTRETTIRLFVDGREIASEEPVFRTMPIEVVVPNLDEQNAASSEVTEEGTTLTATGADGTKFTLTIPDGALTEPAEITMTPLLSAEGLPFSGGVLYGVNLAPEGTRLLKAASLGIIPVAPYSGPYYPVGFMYSDNGTVSHLYPMLRGGDGSYTMRLTHFSGGGAGGATGGDIAAATSGPLTDPRERALNGIDVILAMAEAREPPHLTQEDWDAIGALLDDWYNLGVLPDLLAAMQCLADGWCQANSLASVDELIYRPLDNYLEWAEQRVLLGLGDESLLTSEFMRLWEQHLLNFFDQHNTACAAAAQADPCGQGTEDFVDSVLGLVEQAVLLGLQPPVDFHSLSSVCGGYSSNPCGLYRGTALIAGTSAVPQGYNYTGCSWANTFQAVIEAQLNSVEGTEGMKGWISAKGTWTSQELTPSIVPIPGTNPQRFYGCGPGVDTLPVSISIPIEGSASSLSGTWEVRNEYYPKYFRSSWSFSGSVSDGTLTGTITDTLGVGDIIDSKYIPSVGQVTGSVTATKTSE